MKIVMTGGGSGGHIMPILAVAQQVKTLQPEAAVMYIGQRGDALADIPAQDPNIDDVYAVSAGKLRRYHNEGWRQLFDVRTQALNIRDIFRVLRGVWQSYWLLRRLKPDVIFTRGGFVSVPVALAGKLNGIPYITHDSDSIPSLANRLIARWAHTHAVALPAELYPYPAEKTIVVGIPVSTSYEPVTPALRQEYREFLGLDYVQVVLLTGGGNGARMLNEALIANAKYLLGTFPDLALVHIAGRALEAETNAGYDALQLGAARERVMVHGFVHDLYRYSGAADVVIARGGATNLAEFALQQAACVVVPSKQLSWNVKNSRALAEREAILELTEDQVEQPERLGRTIGGLLEDEALRRKLADTIAAYAHPQAAKELARILVNIAGGAAHARSEK